MQKVLRSYLKRLSNLSGNNRSLLLLRLLSDQFMDIHDLDYVEGFPCFDIIRGLMEQKKHISLCSETDSRTASVNEISRRLKKLQRIEAFLFEERGAKDLYVGWPFIKGKFVDDTLVRCPLLFFPVTIEKKKNTWLLSRRVDVNITLNKTFLLAYSYYNDVKLDERFIETVIDSYEKDALVFRTQLYKLLENNPIELHFNQKNFTDQLQAFRHYRKAEFEKEERTGVLKMFPEAVLGLFPQAGSYLVPDYLKLLETRESNDLEDFFAKRTGNIAPHMSFFDRTSEDNTFTPFPLDAYQERAIKEIKKGNSIVVQGPPGTGKSQLIANLICDFMARGKNVLLVCQKRAALDVVYERLKQKEVQDFVALVHDFKNDRKPIYEQIDRQIESVEWYKKKNDGLDTIQLERGFLQASRRIDQLCQELEEFKQALFNEEECGKSVKELYLTSSHEAPAFSMNMEYRAFHFDTLHETIRKWKRYLQYYNRFEKDTHFWADGPSFAPFKTKDLLRLQLILKEIPLFEKHLETQSEVFSTTSMDFDTVKYFSGKIPEMEVLINGLKDKEIFTIYRHLHKIKPTRDLNWLSQLERRMMAFYKGIGMEESLPTSQIGRFQEILLAGIKARKSLWGWLRWQFFKEKFFLKRVMAANQISPKNFSILVGRIDNRLNFEHLVSEVKGYRWLHEFPRSLRKIDIQDWFYLQKMGLNLYCVAETVRTLNDYLPLPTLDHPQYLEGLTSLKNLSSEFYRQVALWNKYIHNHQIHSIVSKKDDIHHLKRLLKRDFDALCEYHKLKNSFSTEESQTLDKIIAYNPSDIEQAIVLFKNSLSLAWIDHIERKYPTLRSVSSGQLDDQIQELREIMEARRAMSKAILLLKVREKTFSSLTYNRLKNRVTYRSLQYQVTKKRMIWPIRRVIGEFMEEVFTLLPCWMCSPESASAIFPMRELFDLVIFDEASQCFAERGIPAMYRGKQLAIAGDKRQLKPYDLYRVRWEDEDDHTLAIAADSLLSLASYYLPEVCLEGHYRSKHPELIAFSNLQFYRGALKLLPDYEHINKQEPAIHFKKVDGQWEDGLNRKEASYVADLVFQLLTNNHELSIGVVTFNYKQRGLILDKLEEQAETRESLLPPSLFVKNIENVQGDERDVIIFSIGYAPDKRGKIRLQFGSLNADGGENRLNVAVTRARECIYVVSSLLPSQMNPRETKNDGPKLLKKYLEYAWKVNNKQWKPNIPAYKQQRPDWFLRNALQDPNFHQFQEYHLAQELPFADLSVKRNEVYTCLILTDDEHYFQALSTKQIYAFQHFHMKAKHWQYIRFHSRELWVDRSASKEKIRKFLYANP